jgi:hypothetical protein
MRTDSLKQFVQLRRQLSEEKASLEARLRQINEALGEVAATSVSATAGTTGQSASERSGPDDTGGEGGQSLREHVIAVLQEGPKTKEETLAAVQRRGYKFKTKDPLNSLGVILYGKKPKFNRADGKFSLGSASPTAKVERGAGRRGKRTMSPEARARIAEAQRRRWAASRKGQAKAAPVRASSNGTSKRRMSPAARKALAEAARRRWAAAKASGKSRL